MESDLVASEQLHREMLRLNTAASGKDHEFTLLSIRNLAGVLYQQQKYKEARSLTQEEVMIRKRINGPDALETLEPLKRLALVLCRLEELAEETAVRREILTICGKRKGSRHTETTKAAWYLAELLVEMGNQKEAIRIIEAHLLWLGSVDQSELTATQREILERIKAVITLPRD